MIIHSGSVTITSGITEITKRTLAIILSISKDSLIMIVLNTSLKFHKNNVIKMNRSRKL